jgi:hypothetical protein
MQEHNRNRTLTFTVNGRTRPRLGMSQVDASSASPLGLPYSPPPAEQLPVAFFFLQVQFRGYVAPFLLPGFSLDVRFPNPTMAR